MTADHKKTIIFLLMTAVAGALAFAPLRDLVRQGRPSEYYSHILLIPAISGYLFFRRRKKVFKVQEPVRPLGVAFMAAGGGLFLLGTIVQTDVIGRAAMAACGAIFILGGSYLTLFGPLASRKAFFPTAFLAFMIPLPIVVMEGIVAILVTASTGVTSLLFLGLGIPFVQEGATFRLAIFDIEVAQQCSGIRSSIALVITTVLAGHIFVDKFWKKAALVLAVFPVTVFKNGIRIITLYLLSIFVDMRIIEGGFLHRSGGFIFFGLGLVILGFILWVLRESEGRQAEN